MIVDCAHYRDGRRQHEGRWTREEAAAHLPARRRASCGSGMVEPVAGGARATCRTSSACTSSPSRTRRASTCARRSSSTTSGITFVVLRTARYVDEREEVEFGEVVDVRRRPASSSPSARASPATCTARGCGSRSARSCSRRARPPCCGRSWTRSSTTTRRWSRGSSATSRRSSRPCSPAPPRRPQRIYLLRREVTDFYRAVHPLLGPAAAITQGGVLARSPTACASTSATSTTTSSSSTRRSSPSATC